MPFQTLHVLFARKTTVTIHYEGHMFGHGSSLGDMIQIRGKEPDLGCTHIDMNNMATITDYY